MLTTVPTVEEELRAFKYVLDMTSRRLSYFAQKGHLTDTEVDRVDVLAGKVDDAFSDLQRSLVARQTGGV